MLLNPLAVDEAGPLWLMFENFMDWLGFWGRIAFAAVFLLSVLASAALVLSRRKE